MANMTIGQLRQKARYSNCSPFLWSLGLAMSCLLLATNSHAKSYTFTWSANPEPVEGYRLYYKKDGTNVPPFEGTGATEGASPVNTGKVTTYTINGLDDNTTYHFALTAYNGEEESAFSEIVTVEATADSGVTAPQIFNIKVK